MDGVRLELAVRLLSQAPARIAQASQSVGNGAGVSVYLPARTIQ
jgi:hypothetical protein